MPTFASLVWIALGCENPMTTDIPLLQTFPCCQCSSEPRVFAQ